MYFLSALMHPDRCSRSAQSHLGSICMTEPNMTSEELRDGILDDAVFGMGCSELHERVEQLAHPVLILFLSGVKHDVAQALGKPLANGGVIGVGHGQLAKFVEQHIPPLKSLFLLDL